MRAAALSVGIFMMTGAAGAVSACAGTPANFALAGELPAHAIFDPSCAQSSASRPTQGSVPAALAELTLACNTAVESLGAAYRFLYTAGLLTVLRFAVTAAAPAGGEMVDAPRAPHTQSNPGTGIPILSASSLGILPFIRPRRLGPVPFE